MSLRLPSGTDGQAEQPSTLGRSLWFPAAAFVGVAAAYAPLQLALVIGGLVGGYLVWSYPKAGAGAVVVCVLFSQMAAGFNVALNPLDDAAVALFLMVTVLKTFAVGRKPRLIPGTWAFGLFLIAGLASAARSDVPPPLVAADSYLLLKGLLFGLAVAQIDWSPTDVPKILAWAGRVVAAVVVALAANLVMGSHWYALFSTTGQAPTRGGFAIPIGPFNYPGLLAQAMALLGVGACAHLAAYGRSRRSVITLAIGVLGVAMTLRRKAAIGLLAGVATAVGLHPRARARAGVAAAILVPIVLYVSYDAIASVVSATYNQYFTGISTEARTELYRSSVSVAADHWPFGVGLGRFGTITAMNHYSPVYYEYGLNRVYGLEPGGSFGTDTFWPAILGEAGVIGLAAYLVGLAQMLRAPSALRRLKGWAGVERRHVSFIALIAAAWWVEFLVEAAAEPVYTSPPLYPLLFGVFGLCTALLAARPMGDGTSPAPPGPGESDRGYLGR